MLESRFPRLPLRRRLTVATLVSVLLYMPIAQAEAHVVVVVNKDSTLPRLTRAEVAAVFLGKIKQRNDITVTPLDSKDNTLRDHFYLRVADMSGIRVKAYWSRIVFSGRGRPPPEIAAAEAAARLAEEPSAVTYIPANQVTADMRVVFSLP